MSKREREARELLHRALALAWETEDPAMWWSIGHLSRIRQVKYSTETETAAIVSQRGRHKIIFSRSFAERYLKAPADALFVLLHEVYHRIHGDSDRAVKKESILSDLLANVVADVIVNAFLCRRFFPKGMGILERLYSSGRFPEILFLPPPMLAKWHERKGSSKSELLIPPADWTAAGAGELRSLAEKILPEAEIPPGSAKDLSAWYADAWSGRASFQGLYERLTPYVEIEFSILLLGSHSRTLLGGEYDEGQQAGFGEVLEDENLSPKRQTVPVRLCEEIKQALSPDSRNPRDEVFFVQDRSVVCWPGRRELYLMAAGGSPLFFTHSLYGKTEDYRRVHLYLDVSGSTEEVHPFLYGLAIHLGDLLGQPIYLFSNRVEEITSQDLARGRKATTGGTDFDCVIEHAAHNKFGKILLLTDGFASMNEKNTSRVRRGEVEIYLMLTTAWTWTCCLSELAKKQWKLPDYGVHLR